MDVTSQQAAEVGLLLFKTELGFRSKTLLAFWFLV